MRKRRTQAELTADVEPTPIMYVRMGHRLYDHAGRDVMDRLRCGFPRGWPIGPFDYRSGWTRMERFYANDFLTRDEMRELVHNRIGVDL